MVMVFIVVLEMHMVIVVMVVLQMHMVMELQWLHDVRVGNMMYICILKAMDFWSKCIA